MQSTDAPAVDQALAPLALRVNVTWTFAGKVVYVDELGCFLEIWNERR